tara:strand:+ start:6058 stop:6333 length:276 start_codon:yes stop_codon:yes gene_type:complete
MSRLARAMVKVRRVKDQRQEKKIRELELKTNAALKKAKENARMATIQAKLDKAKAMEAAAKRRANAAKIKRNAKRLKEIKKFSKTFLKQLR